jgi:membrane protein
MQQLFREVKGTGRSILQELNGLGLRAGQANPGLARAWVFIREVLRKYHRDDCLTYAASTSFFLTISLIPLTTLFFKLMGLMLGSGAYSPGLQKAISEIYPYLPKGFILDSIRNSRKLGGIGSSWVVLLVGAHWGVNQLDRSLTHIFGLRIKVHRQTRKHPLLRRLALVFGILACLVAALALIFNWALLSNAPVASLRVLHVLPPVFGFCLVTMVLQHLPRLHVAFRHAVLGGLVCSVGWWLAKVGFGWYLDHSSNWGVLYGSLGSVMAALVFLYYCCAIFMLGAEVTAAFYRHSGTGEFQAQGSMKPKDHS